MHMAPKINSFWWMGEDGCTRWPAAGPSAPAAGPGRPRRTPGSPPMPPVEWRPTTAPCRHTALRGERWAYRQSPSSQRGFDLRAVGGVRTLWGLNHTKTVALPNQLLLGPGGVFFGTRRVLGPAEFSLVHKTDQKCNFGHSSDENAKLSGKSTNTKKRPNLGH